MITCDETIDADGEAKSNDKETKTIPKNIICETKSFYILLVFLLITIALLIVVIIYCYRGGRIKRSFVLIIYYKNRE